MANSRNQFHLDRDRTYGGQNRSPETAIGDILTI